MSTATATAQVLVDELVQHGVREAVLAPGSRSAPLAYALHEADRLGRLRLHVRVDERSAGFLAIGLAKGSHRPVPVVTTSGTAVANLHPAVLEASHARVPLIVLSADRPAELRGTGANQTTDQVKLFGDAVASYAEIPAADAVSANVRHWRSVMSRTLIASEAGPVQLNVCFREPLVPGDEPPPLPAGGEPWTQRRPRSRPEPYELPAGPRTVVVAGDDSGPPARLLAQDAGWPLLAEPTSGARTGTHPITTYRLLLGEPGLAGRIERVVMFGHPTLSRPVTRLLSRDDVELIVVAPPGAPVPGDARMVVDAVAAPPEQSDGGWLDEWRAADSSLRKAVDALVLGRDELTPYDVARAVSQAVPPEGLLVVGSSNPIRDLDLMALPYPVGERRMVMANRGLAGIDGTVSTAIGAALGRRSSRSLAYIGDLTFLHDSNGLLLGPEEPRPDLTIVVANDDGGSIFATLEQGEERYARSFERVFATPTGADLGGLCAAMGITYRDVRTRAELAEALAREPEGIEVVEVRVGRADRRRLEADLRALPSR